MRKIVAALQLLLGTMALSGCTFDEKNTTRAAAPPVYQFDLNKLDPRVHVTGEKCNDGNCFYVDIAAPGIIDTANYKCEGDTCGWVWACPDGGKCNLHADPFEINGTTARFWGRTNSSDGLATYKFTITYH